MLKIALTYTTLPHEIRECVQVEYREICYLVRYHGLDFMNVAYEKAGLHRGLFET